jgi:hypothetical protein
VIDHDPRWLEGGLRHPRPDRCFCHGPGFLVAHVHEALNHEGAHYRRGPVHFATFPSLHQVRRPAHRLAALHHARRSRRAQRVTLPNWPIKNQGAGIRHAGAPHQATSGPRPPPAGALGLRDGGDCPPTRHWPRRAEQTVTWAASVGRDAAGFLRHGGPGAGPLPGGGWVDGRRDGRKGTCGAPHYAWGSPSHHTSWVVQALGVPDTRRMVPPLKPRTRLASSFTVTAATVRFSTSSSAGNADPGSSAARSKANGGGGLTSQVVSMYSRNSVGVTFPLSLVKATKGQA